MTEDATNSLTINLPTEISDTKSKQDNRQKKKKSKIVETVLKDMPSDTSDEIKLQTICQKYSDILQEQKDSTVKMKSCEKLLQSVKHERDQLQSERNRLILQKDKLETLCRELQKQNKVIQEENLARTRAEDEKRREVSEHFQTAITAIHSQLNEYQTKNTELRNENQSLAAKLNKFIQQHEKREQHVEKILHARDLEMKLADAKLNKAQCQLDQERLKSQQTIGQLKEEAKLMQDRMDMHLQLENKLKEQIEFYKTKYQKFNKTIAQSNKLFDTAKAEMDTLAKRWKQSELDVLEWRSKWELSQRTLLEVVSDHNAAKKQADRLGSLCRALQTQLRELRQSDVPDIHEIPKDSPPTLPNEHGDGPLDDPKDPTWSSSTMKSTDEIQGQQIEALVPTVASKESIADDFTVIGPSDVAQPDEPVEVAGLADSPVKVFLDAEPCAAESVKEV